MCRNAPLPNYRSVTSGSIEDARLTNVIDVLTRELSALDEADRPRAHVYLDTHPAKDQMFYEILIEEK